MRSQLFGAGIEKELLGHPRPGSGGDHEILRRALESRWRGEEYFQETTKLVTRDGRVIDALFTGRGRPDEACRSRSSARSI